MKKKLVLSIVLAMVMVLGIVLCACGPNSDPAAAKITLQDNGYKAIEDKLITPNALKVLGVEGISTVISGTKTVDKKTEHVTIIYFETTDAANAGWDKVQEYASDDKEEEDTDWTIVKSGKMIYYGTKQAIKAAR